MEYQKYFCGSFSFCGLEDGITKSSLWRMTHRSEGRLTKPSEIRKISETLTPIVKVSSNQEAGRWGKQGRQTERDGETDDI